MPTKSEIVDFLAREFPQSKCVVLEAGRNTATITHRVGADELRPGGTVSGPVLMTVADVALYVALLATIGIVPLAVTTSLTINFLRSPRRAETLLASASSSRWAARWPSAKLHCIRRARQPWWRTRWAPIRYRRFGSRARARSPTNAAPF